MNQTATTESARESMHSLQEHWRLLLAMGIIIVGLGILAILSPLVAGLSATVALGALLIIGAVVHAAHVFTVHGWKGRTAQAVLAVVYLLAGLALVGNPAAGLATLTVLLVAFFVFDGLIEVYGGLKLRPETNWQWMVASGAISIVLAGLIWVTLPFAIVWVVGLLFGINLITTGASMIEIAFGGRKASTDERPSIAEPRGA